ncbi:MAG: toll/interleukin-1 receptor domain-containing protein [Planctomycetaceae bacterium]|nr:toll/interleukin-1 receptor domain-containing protein [Planctomycetales bacterium]MCB9925392.1 toll/interleukin-1 receptor domain-containing protein [Planctomycetaceae bacterium]
MRVFISHKNEDSETAGRIAYRLRTVHLVECYLDVFDPHASKTGDDLGDYLRNVLQQCTELMAVVSEATKESWWVPWEIGVAQEKQQPITTFAGGQCALPTYLKKWPYLKTVNELDTYIRVAKETRRVVDRERYSRTASALQASYTRSFHFNLKRALGQ